MDSRATSIKTFNAGETLAATVIAVALSSMLFVALAAVYLYSVRSFAGLGNYMELDGNAQRALDTMSADIRQADGIASYSSNALTLNVGTNQLTYTFDPTRRTLRRQLGLVARTLLSDCDDVHYDVFQRNPTNGVYDIYPDSTSATNSKLVEVAVVCSRSLQGRKSNTTSLQSARVVIRKQK